LRRTSRAGFPRTGNRMRLTPLVEISRGQRFWRVHTRTRFLLRSSGMRSLHASFCSFLRHFFSLGDPASGANSRVCDALRRSAGFVQSAENSGWWRYVGETAVPRPFGRLDLNTRIAASGQEVPRAHSTKAHRPNSRHRAGAAIAPCCVSKSSLLTVDEQTHPQS